MAHELSPEQSFGCKFPPVEHVCLEGHSRMTYTVKWDQILKRKLLIIIMIIIFDFMHLSHG